MPECVKKVNDCPKEENLTTPSFEQRLPHTFGIDVTTYWIHRVPLGGEEKIEATRNCKRD